MYRRVHLAMSGERLANEGESVTEASIEWMEAWREATGWPTDPSTPSRPVTELRADLAELAEALAVMDDLIESRNDTAPPEQIAELARQSHTLVDRIISSTVALHPPTANVAGERSALLDFVRPGSWFGAGWDPDGRMLTPEQTDYAIIYMLHQLTDPLDAAELRCITGPLQSAATYQCQSGGIHHDPLVRLLAFRAWGDRHRYWFDERGVRKGDRVRRLPAPVFELEPCVGRAWPGEPSFGPACADALPGQRVEVEAPRDSPPLTLFLVADRPREPPGHHGAFERNPLVNRISVSERSCGLCGHNESRHSTRRCSSCTCAQFVSELAIQNLIASRG
jgi:hypothetical protein